MWIDSRFDGGNIAVARANDPMGIDLEIRPDGRSEHLQWFCFRVLGAGGHFCKFRILNARDAAYPEAWPDGSVVMSYDGRKWFRRPTRFEAGVLLFDLSCDADCVHVALSPPFHEAQHHALIASALSSGRCGLLDAITTVEGRRVEVLSAGNPASEGHKVWIIARQHPGEPMAEWFMQGLLDRLLHSDDARAGALLDRCRFYLVPNMNPDGSAAGHLRTNAAGVDLNRAWADPDKATTPEVFDVKAHMQRTGVDLFLDIHGDEEIRFVFAAGCEGNPGFTPRLARQDSAFRAAFRRANPDFSTANGYPVDPPGTADLSIACNQVSKAFGCLALTIEMPFKDNADRPDPKLGWGIPHSRALGASVLEPIAAHFGIVSSDQTDVNPGAKWASFPER